MTLSDFIHGFGYIGDYNGEGMDSVPSVDFGPAAGGNLPERPTVLRNDPLPDNDWTAEDWERLRYEQMTEGEKEREQDSYLAKHGIL